MANNELIRGIADAVAGGALAGLSRDAQMDFLSPFLQAQQNRLNREYQKESTAYSNYSSGARAAREAFAFNPLGEGRLQAYQQNEQKRLDLALGETTNEAARQALVDSYEANIAFAQTAYEGGVVNQASEAGRAGDYSFLTSDQTPALKQQALEQLTAKGTTVLENFGELQTIAERLANTGASTGDLPGSVTDATRLSIAEADPELQSIVNLVQQTEGGLVPWVLANPEQGRTLMEALGGTNPQAIQGLHRSLEKQERALELRGQLGQLRDARTSQTALLYSPDIYEIDESGNKQFRQDRVDQVIDTLNREHQFAGDMDAELRRLESVGVNVDYVRGIAVPREEVRPPSSTYLGDTLSANFSAAVDLASTGKLADLAGDTTFRQLVQFGQKAQAESYLRQQGFQNTTKVYDLFRDGPASMMSNLVDEALGQEAYLEGERARLTDQLAIASANGDQVEIARVNKEMTSLGTFAGSADIQTIKNMQLSAFQAAGHNTQDGYENALGRVLFDFKRQDLLTQDGGLSPEVQDQITQIMKFDDPLRRHEAFGDLLITASFSGDSPIAPEQAAARDRARQVAMDLNSRMVRAMPQAVRRSGAIKSAAGLPETASPMDTLYAIMSMSSIDQVLSPPTTDEFTEAQRNLPGSAVPIGQ